MAKPTYAELSTLANSSPFIERTSVATAKYARFILNEDPATVNHQRRFDWARQAINNVNIIGGLRQAIAIDTAFADQDPLDFAATSDAVVQSAVEATVNSTVLTF